MGGGPEMAILRGPSVRVLRLNYNILKRLAREREDSPTNWPWCGRRESHRIAVIISATASDDTNR